MTQKEDEARPVSIVANVPTGKRVGSTVSIQEDIPVSFYPLTAKKVTGCPYYHKEGCIVPDLCRQRSIEYCPLRARWCQELNETDDQFFEWCLNHPVGGA